MDKIIGFIGYGNMAKSMVGSMIRAKLVPAENIIASSLRGIKDNTYQIRTTTDNKDVARQSDYLILAVKPNNYKLVINEIKDYIKEKGVIISIAAGISTSFLKQNLNKGTKFVKVMPNTPALVGEGMSAVAKSDIFSEEEFDEILSILNTFGRTEVIHEYQMDGFTALCGSSPAYVYMMIEAMADGAVLEGIPRAQAYTMAAQAVLGSAKMVLETGLHPGILKDNVCSPSGTTIEAVASLEENGFRSAIIEAIRVCAEKSREMSK